MKTEVQHLSLYHPGFKVPSVLLQVDRPVNVRIRLDGDRDLEGFERFLRDLTNEDVSFDGESKMKFVSVVLKRQEITEVAARPEVLWIEPALTTSWSGERQAMVVAGLHNGLRPDDPQPGVSHEGYEEWLLEKGFCTPSAAPSGCYPYWTKVGVFDSGLNTLVCSGGGYNVQTGVCTNWVTNIGHPDLNHTSNLQSACAGQSSDCSGPVLQGFFCAEGESGSNQCYTGGNYSFSDAVAASGGHGTSTTSIIASIPSTNPLQTDNAGYFRGMGLAPSSQVILAKFDDLYQGGGTTDPGMSELHYEDLMAKVENRGARFANNSWNLAYNQRWYDPTDPQYSLPYTAYSGFSEVVDQLVRDGSGDFDSLDDPMTIIFSSGNAAGFLNTWVTSPGNAKNAISVGATRGWSTTGAAGAAHFGCSSMDHEIDDVCGGSGWNSRRLYIGEDGAGSDLPRFKPDLVAPGSQIVAARAQETGFVDYYTCFWGTSAAAPSVSAAAILAEAWYYYVVTSGSSLPSPAMIKAMLIAHADDMYGGIDHLTSATLPHSPSPAQGWGRVNLDGLFQEDVAVTVFDEDHNATPTRRFTAPGQSWSIQLEVDDETKPIIAVMTFTDAPSLPTASGSLVQNDLQLWIIKPGTIMTQQTFVGNLFEVDSWYSKKFGMLLPSNVDEEHNNVKVIRIGSNQLRGPFTLQVSSFGINAVGVPGLDNGDENQDFALYVFNAVTAN